MEYQVILFYKYVTIADPAELAGRLRALAESLSLKGRLLIAEEGLNGTFEGLTADTDRFASELLEDPRFSDMQIKKSAGTGKSFPKLQVRVRKEIVGTKFPFEEVDPRIATAPRLSPEELRSWFESQQDFVVVDMRNDYEFASGHFSNSINPGLENSRDLPLALQKLEPLKGKKVVTVCTGGVRCEKMSAFLQKKGFSDVYQLDGGIHTYMEKYPAKDFLGTLYTFDGRLTMHFGGERSIVGRCRFCEAPTERYFNCQNDSCHLHFLACDACAKDAISDGPVEKMPCGDACRAHHASLSSHVSA